MVPSRSCRSRPTRWISRAWSASDSCRQPWATVRSRAISVVGLARTTPRSAAYSMQRAVGLERRRQERLGGQEQHHELRRLGQGAPVALRAEQLDVAAELARVAGQVGVALVGVVGRRWRRGRRRAAPWRRPRPTAPPASRTTRSGRRVRVGAVVQVDLLEEVAAVDQAGHLDRPAQVELAPSAAHLGPAQRGRQASASRGAGRRWCSRMSSTCWWSWPCQVARACSRSWSWSLSRSRPCITSACGRAWSTIALPQPVDVRRSRARPEHAHGAPEREPDQRAPEAATSGSCARGCQGPPTTLDTVNPMSHSRHSWAAVVGSVAALDPAVRMLRLGLARSRPRLTGTGTTRRATAVGARRSPRRPRPRPTRRRLDVPPPTPAPSSLTVQPEVRRQAPRRLPAARPGRRPGRVRLLPGPGQGRRAPVDPRLARRPPHRGRRRWRGLVGRAGGGDRRRRARSRGGRRSIVAQDSNLQWSKRVPATGRDARPGGTSYNVFLRLQVDPTPGDSTVNGARVQLPRRRAAPPHRHLGRHDDVLDGLLTRGQSVEVDDHRGVVGGALPGPLLAVDERAGDPLGQRRGRRARSRSCRPRSRSKRCR